VDTLGVRPPAHTVVSIKLEQNTIRVTDVYTPDFPPTVGKGLNWPSQLNSFSHQFLSQCFHIINSKGKVADTDLVQQNRLAIWLLARMAGQRQSWSRIFTVTEADPSATLAVVLVIVESTFTSISLMVGELKPC
jgi:hypothetical protein